MIYYVILISVAVVVVGFAFYGLAGGSKREDKSNEAGSSDGNDGHGGAD